MDREFSPSYVLFGLLLVGMGVLMLGDRLEWTGFSWNVPVWPFILMTLGATRLMDHRLDAQGRERINRTAIWLIFIGLWGLLNEYQLFGVHYRHSWPLLVIGAGAMVVWQAVDPLTCAPKVPSESRS
jgi:hypothetical protein